MAGTPFRDGPDFVAVAVANIYVPAAGTYALVRHIHIANTNAASRTLALYVGATGGSANGTELCEGKVIPLNDVYELYFPSGLKLTSADFLTGVSSVDGTSLVCTITGELYVV